MNRPASPLNLAICAARLKFPHLSYGDLAQMFHVTRNTVAGAVWRGNRQARA